MCRTGKAEEAVPGFIDGRGERIEVEHRDRTEVRQGLHECQCHARANRRTRHGQGNPPERLQRRMPQYPRGLHQTLALSNERSASQQVDVGVEHQHQHRDHATGGAHPRQTHRPEPLAQQGLHRPGKIQQADKDERQYIGRDGEGQHQGPIEPTTPGKLTKAGQPGQADAQQGDTNADTGDQCGGIAQQAGHLGFEQVRPDLPVNRLPGQEQNTDRQQHQGDNGENQGIPAALGRVGQRAML